MRCTLTRDKSSWFADDIEMIGDDQQNVVRLYNYFNEESKHCGKAL